MTGASAWTCGQLLPGLGQGLDGGVDAGLLVGAVGRLPGLGFQSHELLHLRVKPGQLRTMRFEQGVDLRGRLERHEVFLGPADLGTGERVARAAENAVETVVVAGRERIELVIVAAGAGNGRTENGAAHIVDGIFERQMMFAIAVAAEAPGDGEIAGGDDALACARPPCRRASDRRQSARGETDRTADRD